MEGGGAGPQHCQPGEGGWVPPASRTCLSPVESSRWDASGTQALLKGSVNTPLLSKQADRSLSEARAGFPPAKGCGCGAGVGPGAGARSSHARSAPAPTCSAQERTRRAQAKPGGKGRRVTPWQGAAEPEVPPSPHRKSVTPRLSQQWVPPAQVPPGPCPPPGPRAPDGPRAGRVAPEARGPQGPPGAHSDGGGRPVGIRGPGGGQGLPSLERARSAQGAAGRRVGGRRSGERLAQECAQEVGVVVRGGLH